MHVCSCTDFTSHVVSTSTERETDERKQLLSHVYVAVAKLFTAHKVYLLLPLHVNDNSKLLSVAVRLP